MKNKVFILIALFLFSFHTFGNNESKPTICLNMIVKNEETIIKRCLNSVKDIIDYWVIVDTGSTDRTQEEILEFMKDIPGELHEYPWKNFEHNRNIALDLARNKSDYILFMDADDQLIFKPNFQLPYLTSDSYRFKIKFGGVSYYRNFIIKNSEDWKWKGAIHECIISDKPKSSEILRNVYVKVNRDGARGKDPKVFEKDITILEKALLDEPNNTRYQFYLAQSYRDNGNYKKAIEQYKKRIEMGGWNEEIYWSYYQIALMKQNLNFNSQKCLNALMKAFLFRPSRIEALYYIINFYRLSQDYQTGYAIGKMALSIPKSKDSIFVQKWMYDYGLLLETSICAYYIGKYEKAKFLSEEILKSNKLPQDIVDCVKRNLTFINSKMEDKL